MRKFVKLLAITLLLVGGLGLRLYLTDKVPTGISHDELDYYLSGRSIALSGTDLTKAFSVWPPKPLVTATLTAELTPLWFVPVNWISPSSLFSAKITTAIFGTLNCLLIYWLLKSISKNITTSLIGMMLAVINPWWIIFSRTGYEITIATFWLLFAIGLQLKLKAMDKFGGKWWGWFGLWIVAAMMAFFNYHGFKALTPAIILIVSIYDINKYGFKNGLLKLVAFMGITICLVGYLLINRPIYQSRMGELSTAEDKNATATMLTVGENNLYTPLTKYFQSPWIYKSRELVRKYLDVFNLRKIFFAEDEWLTYPLSEHGYLYLIEIVTVAVGIMTMIYKREYLWFLILIASPLPSLIHAGSTNYIRASFLIVPLICLSAIGIRRLINIKPIVTVPILIFAFGVSLVNFGYIYGYRYPVFAYDQQMTEYRVLASYLGRINDGQQVTIITSSPYQLVRQLIFYHNDLNKQTVADWQQVFSTQKIESDYVDNNLKITNDCNKINATEGMLIVDQLIKSKCEDQLNKFTLKQRVINPINREAKFYIYNQGFCEAYWISDYPKPYKLNHFEIEKLENEQFCSIWIGN